METSLNKLLERRKLMRTAGLSAAAAAALSLKTNDAKAATTNIDPAILNFALNLEYLEAEYYLRAVTGGGLTANGVAVTGTGTAGTVTGGSQVPFQSRTTYQLAREIAMDEMAHVKLLRSALGSAAVAEPNIDLVNSFNAAAAAAGLGSSFDPFANENNFLLGAFIFEDVGVSAYAGAAALITSKAYLTTAAQILAVEAYHAGEIRTRLYLGGYSQQTALIAALRAKASGTGPGSVYLPTPDDMGVMSDTGQATIVDADTNALAFTRSTSQVLNVVYLGTSSTGGGFFPSGVNGSINTVSYL